MELTNLRLQSQVYHGRACKLVEVTEELLMLQSNQQVKGKQECLSEVPDCCVVVGHFLPVCPYHFQANYALPYGLTVETFEQGGVSPKKNEEYERQHAEV